jgi:iron complex outermembrane recepter protein
MTTSARKTFGALQTAMFLLGVSASAAVSAQESPPPASSPPAEAAKADDSTQLEAIEVTGSRISRVDAIAESPIYTIDAKDLVNSGFITVDHFLNTLPQIVPNISSQSNNPSSNGRAFIDLRGLGPNRNLVLIDGKRPMGQASGGTIVDTNIIPAALVERIEIISGGAAATYGSDAVAGVVNFIMKKDYEGFAIDSQFRETQQKDGIERGVAMTAGNQFSDGKGSAVFNFSYFSRDAMYKDSRDFSGQASTTTGSFPNGSYNPGANVPSQAAVDAMFGAGLCNANGGATGFGLNPDGSPFCTGVAGDAGARDVQGYTGPAEDIATAFFPDLFSYNFEPDNILVLPLQRYNLFGNFALELNEHFNPYAQLMFTNYNALQELAPTPASGATGFSIPVTNPFIPAALDTLLDSRATPAANFAFSKRFKNLGGRTGYNTHDVWQLTTGTKGYIAGTWNYDVYASFGRSVLNERQGGNVRLDRVNDLLDDADGGAAKCDGGLNLFGAAVISPSCQARITLEAKNLTVSEQGIIETEFSGNLLELPAGALQAAIGASYRDVDFDFRPDAGLQPGVVAGFNEQLPVNGRLDYTDYFAELYVPILADLPAVKSLSATLGLRSTDNNIFGVANSYKLTMDWQINDMVRTRGGFQHAIRSPNVAELFSPQVNSFPTATGADPCNTTGANSFNSEFGRNATDDGTATGVPLDGAGGTTDVRGMVRSLCEAQDIAAGSAPDLATGASSPTFSQPAGQFNAIVGGNPDLVEETADSWSIGVVSTPLEKLTFSVDYFVIEMEDVIAAVSAVTIAQRCFNRDGANPTYDINNSWCQLWERDISTFGVTRLQQLSQNQAFVSVEGVDLDASYSLGVGPGELGLKMLATYLMKTESQVTPVDPVNDFAGTIGQTTGSSAPEWKGTFLTSYSWNNLTTQLTNRYISAMDHANTVTGSSPLTNTSVDATWYTDVGVDYRLPMSLTLRAGINNVSNQQPRLYTPNVQSNTDPSVYDVLGRTYFVGVSWEM